MLFLTKIPSWILFFLILTPFIVSGFLENLFFVIGLFLGIYWIISVGKYGTMLLDYNKNYIAFTISNRLIFLSLAGYILLERSKMSFIFGIPVYNVSFVTAIIFYASLLFTTIYAAYIFNLLKNKKNNIPQLILTAVLFWIFPVGVWILQPTIKELLGNEIE